MSELQQSLTKFLFSQEKGFTALDVANGNLLDFKQECLFAKQQILKNDFTFKIAEKNPNSLQAAVLNIAAIGISLNPANQHAYLVPRGGAICLDLSYRGLVKLATDSGAIKWAKVELVYTNDTFRWCGPAQQPEHVADPFSDRGDLKGGYCIAKLCDGEILTEVMKVDEINKIRDTSKASGNGPWVNWYDEMAKKTILKRAYKSWPQTANRQRLDNAVQVLHETEGLAYSIEEQSEYMNTLRSGDGLSFYLLRQKFGDDKWIALYNSFEKGQKVSNKKIAGELEDRGIEELNNTVQMLEDGISSDDETAVAELIGDYDGNVRDMFISKLSPEHQTKLSVMSC